MRRQSGVRNAGGVTGARVGSVVGIIAVLASATAALASPASYTRSGWGFDAATLGGLPLDSIDASTPFLSAGESGSAPNLDIEFTGSTAICVLASGSNVCGPSNPPRTGPFSVLVSLTLDTPANPSSDSFTLMLTSLVGRLGYGRNDVKIELSPVAPVNLDTSAVPGFVWNGGFTPFIHVRDESDGPRRVHDYIGWRVQYGSTVTFRYDVVTRLKRNAYPQLTANAVPFVVVPEPGAVVLVGLALAGLSAGARRAGRSQN
jgi:hypothetical protein